MPDPQLVDMTTNSFVLCTNVQVYLIIIHSGWCLAWIFMKERVNGPYGFLVILVF